MARKQSTDDRMVKALRVFAMLVLLLASGCGGDDEISATDPPITPEESPSCDVGDVVLEDGSCQAPGVPADACGTGFVSDDVGGCVATLPPAPCSGGQTALTGETACRDIVSCGSGDWGDIATDATTEYVDRSYSGGASDGSEANPWTTLNEALAAAADGAVVAVAAGNYGEGLNIGRPLTIWGRCPSMVTISGSGPTTAPMIRLVNTTNVVVRGVALSGPRDAIVVEDGAAELRDLWIYNTQIGIQAVTGIAETTVNIVNSRVERAVDVGVLLLGASAQLTDSVIANTQPLASGRYGRAIDVEVFNSQAGHLDMQHSIVDGAFEFGVYLSGASATIDSTLVRNVQPTADTGEFGRGINVQANDSGARSTATITASVVELTSESGLDVRDSDGTFDAVVVRDIVPRTDQKYGHGVSLHEGGSGANLTMRRSLVERSFSLGIGVFGGHAELDGVAIRSVAPYPSAGWFGRGFSVQPHAVLGASANLRNCAVSDTHDVAFIVFDSPVTLDNCKIAGAAARLSDANYGDGINVVGSTASLELDGVLVHDAVRAGVGNFGAHVGMGNSAFMCNSVHLNGEVVTGAFSFDDRGGNACGCDDQRDECHVLSSKLEPPSAGEDNE